MSEMDEMRRRQDTFDMRLTTLEEKVDAEANLRAAMNEDISDIKVEQHAQRRLLQAVAVTQSEHTARLVGLETDVAVLKTDVAVLKTDVAVLKTDMAQVKSTLGNVQVGVQTIIAILDRQIDEAGGDGPRQPSRNPRRRVARVSRPRPRPRPAYVTARSLLLTSDPISRIGVALRHRNCQSDEDEVGGVGDLHVGSFDEAPQRGQAK